MWVLYQSREKEYPPEETGVDETFDKTERETKKGLLCSSLSIGVLIHSHKVIPVSVISTDVPKCFSPSPTVSAQPYLPCERLPQMAISNEARVNHRVNSSILSLSDSD